MNYSIDKKAGEPAYIQLYRQLIRDITSGVYPYGTRLPSKRVMAEETGVSVVTVEHATALLCEEGYTQARQRSGMTVTYRGEDFLKGQEETEGPPEIRAQEQVHSKSEFPLSILTRTMRRVMLDYGERLLIKSPNHGCGELRGELRLYLARSRGLNVKASQIIVGSGAEYLYGLIVQLLGTKRIYALEKPSYKKIYEVYSSMGAVCEHLCLSKNGIATEDLEKSSAQILHVTPFNSFPSGVTADISKKLEYLRWAKARGAVLIEDNYDSELTVSRKIETPLFSLSYDDNVIYLNSFSRTIAPSIRIGYMILPETMVDEFNEKLGFYSCTVPIFDQYVLSELIKSGDFERHINRIRRKRRRGEKEEWT